MNQAESLLECSLSLKFIISCQMGDSWLSKSNDLFGMEMTYVRDDDLSCRQRVSVLYCDGKPGGLSAAFRHGEMVTNM